MSKVALLTDEINALEFKNLGEMDTRKLAEIWESNLPEGLTRELVEANTAYRHEFHEAMLRSRITERMIEETPGWTESLKMEVVFKTPDVDFALNNYCVDSKSRQAFITADLIAPISECTRKACVELLMSLYDEPLVVGTIDAAE